MKKKKNKGASDLGKLSAEKRKAKYGITNWSEHMKKVRNGKKIEIRTVEVKHTDD